MTKKTHKAKHGHISNEAVMASPKTVSEARDSVNAALAAGKQKTAVEIAKEFHASIGSEESRALLLDAYFARVSGMYAKNMPDEARGLMDVVLDKFPEARPRFEALLRKSAAGSSSLEALLAPLLNPALSDAERAAIESLLRNETTNLAAVADCKALPESHPLRMQARQLHRALETVCTREVQEDELALDLVSRRSPLAPWKMLIQALAAFYRFDDEACLRFANAIAEGSAPARLVPMLRALVGKGEIDALPPAQRDLVNAVVTRPNKLAGALAKVDACLQDRQSHPEAAIDGIVSVIYALDSASSDLRNELLFRVEALFVALMAPSKILRAACPKPARKDARFWQFAATVAGTNDPLFEAILWNEFRLHAIHEGRIRAGGYEEALLLQKMAHGLEDCGAGLSGFDAGQMSDTLRDAEEMLSYLHNNTYKGQPAGIQAVVSERERERILAWLDDPDELYRRAAECAADPEFYEEWYELRCDKKATGQQLEEPL